MSDETRIMVGLAFISLPTIAFGGYFLLSILKRAAGTEGITETQRDYFRAGHAHAGVLVLLGIVGQLFLDGSKLDVALVWGLRIGLVAAPLLISGGFFRGAPREKLGKAGPLAALITAGAVVLSISTIGVGVSLLVSG
jgi:hypothetical protein